MPPKPGVYWFLSQNSEVLYVGKAKNLKNRLTFYRQLHQIEAPKTLNLLRFAKQVKWKALGSELEAILVEAELIKRYQPKYNSQLKDDKSPLYIIITSEKFPRALTARKTDLKTIINLKTYFGPFPSAYKVRSILKIARRLFPYCNQKRSSKKQACFYYHLHLCPGVCVHQIDLHSYRQIIRRLKLFLKGKTKTILKDLNRQMHLQAKKLQFEAAQATKATIDSLTYLTTSQNLGLDLSIPLLTDDLSSHQLQALKNLLSSYSIIETQNQLQRIEAYDISNISGQKATGSLVVFIEGQPAKNDYRRFRIRFPATPDDQKMIQEILSRRLRHPEWGTPDLIIVDGGKPQLQAAAKIIKAQIPLIGIAKRPDRLVLPTQTGFIYYSLEPTQPETQLVSLIRNEAHRFALSYHQLLRSRAI